MQQVITTTHTIDSESFIQSFLNPHQPLLIKAYAPASTSKKQLQSVVSLFGSHPMQVKIPYIEQLQAQSSLEQNPEVMSLEDFIVRLEQSPSCRQCMVEEPTPASVLEQIGIPDLTWGRGVGELVSNTFVAGKGNHAQLHFDCDQRHVLLMQLFGRKRVFLIHPKDSPKLLPVLNQSWWMLQNMALDCKRHLLSSCEYWEVELEPGDMIYIPMMFWHHIDYLDTGVSVNFRFGNRPENTFISEHLHRDSFIQRLSLFLDSTDDDLARQAIMTALKERLSESYSSAFEAYSCIRQRASELCQLYCEDWSGEQFVLDYEESMVRGTPALMRIIQGFYQGRVE
ncbi:cupin-like domain-containing protein [Endozoicomonas numazuensis]|uniref:JmjC domain-containing protein n=1 Tax=Endozoicomonas numazuensis TaxID=1137799 RepID=A0A081NMP3_9GAMM|nr:cupin-like domain-containing protein [Endozoicomonas numazuensis]KEQ19716.1 hypothetical protein GZ78_07525 [Endozoicomonas numazuensis]